MQTINLDDLERTRHTIVKNDVSYPVSPITGRISNMIAAADEAEGVAQINGYYDAVALLLPTMARDLVQDLSMKQLFAVMKLAGTQVRAVEAAASDPNADSSTTEQPSSDPAAT